MVTIRQLVNVSNPIQSESFCIRIWFDPRSIKHADPPDHPIWNNPTKIYNLPFPSRRTFFFWGFYNKHERLVQNTALQHKLQNVKDVDFTIVDRDMVWKLGESLCSIFLFTFMPTCARWRQCIFGLMKQSSNSSVWI